MSSVGDSNYKYVQTLIESFPSYKENLNKLAQSPQAAGSTEKVADLLRKFVYFSIPQTEETRGAHAFANEEFPEAWQWYVRKSCKNVEGGAYGENPNYIFGQESHEAVLKQLKIVREAPEKATLSETYAFFAKKRQETAEKTKTPRFELFGQMRESARDKGLDTTIIKSGLAHYDEKSRKIFLESIKNKSPLEEFPLDIKTVKNRKNYRVYLHEGNSYIGTYVNDKGEEELAFFFSCEKVLIDGKEIDRIINRIAYSKEGVIALFIDGDKDEEWGFFNKLMITPAGPLKEAEIFHCPDSNLPLFTPLVAALFKEILSCKPGDQRAKVLDRIAGLHWELANMMLTSRGNAAITEDTIVMLLLYHGFHLSPYKAGIIADMEALISSKEQFIRNYSSLRETSLIGSKVEQGFIYRLGGYENYQNVPAFPYDPDKHDGSTDYLTLRSAEVTALLMRGEDRLQR